MRWFYTGLGNAAVVAFSLALIVADAGYAPALAAVAVMNGYVALFCIAMGAVRAKAETQS